MKKLFLGILFGFSLIDCVYADNNKPVRAIGCVFNQIPVHPTSDGRADIFSGKGQSITVQFNNEDTGNAEVDAFPMPPVKIINTMSGHVCEIEQGGIWVRKDIYLSSSENFLLMHEYSGSNDFLMLYRTTDCKKLHEIDVSGSAWKISTDHVALGITCKDSVLAHCQSSRDVNFDQFCGPDSSVLKNGNTLVKR